MSIFHWLLEFLYWLTNAITHIFPFVEPGRHIENPKEKTTIVIFSPSFTGPILYYFAKKYFENRGFQIYIINFSNEMKDLEIAAEKMGNILKGIDKKHVCLVGISGAGLVGYEYLNKLSGWKYIDSFVAIAVPFKGTKMAYFQYITKTGRQLLPHSSYIKKISEIKPSNLDRTYCIIAKQDELVPRESSKLKGAHIIELPVIGHVHLHAYSRLTFNAIIEIAKKH